MVELNDHLKLSVVIPLYNKAYIFDRCLESVSRQTRQPDEIVIVDDGSTDESHAIAVKFKENNAQLNVVILKQNNSGVSVARNRGINASSSEYICLLDADDEWKSDFLATMAQLILDYPGAGLYCLGHEVVRGGGVAVKPKHGCRDGFRGYVGDFFKASCRGSVANSSKVCVSKKSILNIGGFPEGVSAGEDLYVWIMLALNGSVASESKVCTTVYQLDDESRGARKNSIPYPLVYFGKEKELIKNNSGVTSYISMIALKHVASSVSDSNYKEALQRLMALKRITVFRFFVYFSIIFVPPFMLRRLQKL